MGRATLRDANDSHFASISADVRPTHSAFTLPSQTKCFLCYLRR